MSTEDESLQLQAFIDEALREAWRDELARIQRGMLGDLDNWQPVGFLLGPAAAATQVPTAEQVEWERVRRDLVPLVRAAADDRLPRGRGTALRVLDHLGRRPGDHPGMSTTTA